MGKLSTNFTAWKSAGEEELSLPKNTCSRPLKGNLSDFNYVWKHSSGFTISEVFTERKSLGEGQTVLCKQNIKDDFMTGLSFLMRHALVKGWPHPNCKNDLRRCSEMLWKAPFLTENKAIAHTFIHEGLLKSTWMKQITTRYGFFFIIPWLNAHKVRKDYYHDKDEYYVLLMSPVGKFILCHWGKLSGEVGSCSAVPGDPSSGLPPFSWSG